MSLSRKHSKSFFFFCDKQLFSRRVLRLYQMVLFNIPTPVMLMTCRWTIKRHVINSSNQTIRWWYLKKLANQNRAYYIRGIPKSKRKFYLFTIRHFVFQHVVLSFGSLFKAILSLGLSLFNIYVSIQA